MPRCIPASLGLGISGVCRKLYTKEHRWSAPAISAITNRTGSVERDFVTHDFALFFEMRMRSSEAQLYMEMDHVLAPLVAGFP